MLKKTHTIIKRMGFIVSLFYFSNKLLNAIHRCITLNIYYVMSQPVKLPYNSLKNRQKKTEIKTIIRNDPLLKAFPRASSEIKKRFDNKSVCFVAIKNGELIGFLWIVSGSYCEIENRTEFTPLPDKITVWDFDLYIKPEERLGFTFMLLWNEANQYMISQCVKNTMSRVSAYNPESIRPHKRMGAVRVATLLYFSFFNFQILLANIPPFVKISFSRKSIPKLKVKAN